MITFYRNKNCRGCSDIQDVLEELAIAYKAVKVEDNDDQRLPEGKNLPVLVDEGKVIQGSDAIIEHLEELEEFQRLWGKYQSDACYCDEEGNVE
jgi:glutathione S-transferase